MSEPATREQLIELLQGWITLWGEDPQLGDETLAVLEAEGALPEGWKS